MKSLGGSDEVMSRNQASKQEYNAELASIEQLARWPSSSARCEDVRLELRSDGSLPNRQLIADAL